MKACLPRSSKMVGRHFGKSPEFVCYLIDSDKVVATEVYANPGRDKVSVPEMVAGFGATHVIAYGIGSKAKSILAGRGIAIISGAAGSVDTVLERFIKGELKPEDVPCAGENACEKR